MKKISVFIGYDPREAAAFAVARASIRRHSTIPVPIHGLVLDDLRARGLYTRPHEQRGCQIWDVISDAPCATQFSNTRFLVPHLAGSGWALFMDCDMLVRANIRELFDLCDPDKAVMVVKHNHQPPEGVKMDGQAQTRYSRKNWSSVVAFQCDHPANKALTVEMVNTLPGRDLHRFCWLSDELIGELPVEWNWLAGHSDPAVDPKIVHHTEGSPCMAGYEDAPYADEWRAELARWAA